MRNITHESIKSLIFFKSFNFNISFLKNSGTVVGFVSITFLKKKQLKIEVYPRSHSQLEYTFSFLHLVQKQFSQIA